MVTIRFSRKTVLSVFASTLLFTSVGCGAVDQMLNKKDKSDNSQTQETVNVSFDLRHADSVGLGLAGVSLLDFVGGVSGCSSGYSANVNSTTASPVSSVALYKFDTGCQAFLTSFRYENKLYTRQGGGNLSTGSAIFTASDGSELNITVGATLASPLTDGGLASFTFQEIKLGGTYSVSSYSVSQTLEIAGLEAPNLQVQNAELTAIESTTGKATFKVTFECGLLSSSGACPTANGDNQAMADMKAKLVSNTYGGVLTYAQAASIMTSGSTAVTTVASPGTPTNGGFILNLQQATGPLFSNKNMILVLEFTDKSASSRGTSYRYFQVDIGDPM